MAAAVAAGGATLGAAARARVSFASGTKDGGRDLQAVLTESLDVVKCRQLLRTVAALAPDVDPEQEGGDSGEAPEEPEPPLEEAGAEVWRFREHQEGEADDDAAAASSSSLEALPDPEGGALLLSHAWDPPEAWSKYFVAQSYEQAKRLLVRTGLRRAAQRGLARAGTVPRVWVDSASLPNPVSEEDHPLGQVTFGPYALTVRDLKDMLASSGEQGSGYTVLKLPEGHHFEGTMQKRSFDHAGRPSKDTEPVEVSWDMSRGVYHVSAARVLPDDRLSPDEAAKKKAFRPGVDQLAGWCTALCLKDEVWVELTLGTFRTECLQNVEPMIRMHGGLVAVVTWNYFDRLWPLCEWALFCARRGPDRVQLASDAVCRPALAEFHRAVRRLSVEEAGCRDPRDRRLLLALLEGEFQCGAKEQTVGFHRPAPHALTAPATQRIVDWTPLERYLRVTAIAVFAREAAIAASREPKSDDEGGWMVLAESLQLKELLSVLKKCKPWDWGQAAIREVKASGGLAESAEAVDAEDPEAAAAAEAAEEDAIDAAYLQRVEAWWASLALPVLEDERRRAVRRP